MRFYTGQHLRYCGIGFHARSLYLCILETGGARVLVPRKLPCHREAGVSGRSGGALLMVRSPAPLGRGRRAAARRTRRTAMGFRARTITLGDILCQ